MTAEIAILNRIAVALAADSAVTIRRGSGSETKVYNSVDKLFCLSNTDPVGVMINGTGEYMGIPAETIIKSFRDAPEGRTRDTVREYATGFFEFLQRNFGATPEQVTDNTAAILVRRVGQLVQLGLDAWAGKSKGGRLSDAGFEFIKKDMSERVADGIAEA